MNNINGFFLNLTRRHRNYFFPQEPLSSTKIREFNLSLKLLFIYSSSSILLFQTLNDHFHQNNKEYFKIIGNLIIRNFLSNRGNERKFSNVEIFFKKIKIFAIKMRYFSFLVVSSEKTNNCLLRLYALFLNTVVENLVGDCYNNIHCVRTLLKIIEVYFIHPLTEKFCNVLKYILKVEQNKSGSSNHTIVFKNLILLNGENFEQIFNYRKIIFKRIEKYNYTLKDNKILKTLLKDIIIEKEKEFNTNNKNYYSKSLELVSTFPRLQFILRHIKVNNGLILIEIFTIKKLCRNEDKYFEYKENYQLNQVSYKLKSSDSSYHFRKLFDRFIIEYLPIVHGMLCKYPNPKTKMLYFDKKILSIISEVVNIKISDEELIAILYKKFKQREENIKMNDEINNFAIKETESDIIETDEKNMSPNSDSKIESNDIDTSISFLNYEDKMLSDILKYSGSFKFNKSSEFEFSIAIPKMNGINKNLSFNNMSASETFNGISIVQRKADDTLSSFVDKEIIGFKGEISEPEDSLNKLAFEFNDKVRKSKSQKHINILSDYQQKKPRLSNLSYNAFVPQIRKTKTKQLLSSFKKRAKSYSQPFIFIPEIKAVLKGKEDRRSKGLILEDIREKLRLVNSVENGGSSGTKKDNLIEDKELNERIPDNNLIRNSIPNHKFNGNNINSILNEVKDNRIDELILSNPIKYLNKFSLKKINNTLHQNKQNNKENEEEDHIVYDSNNEELMKEYYTDKNISNVSSYALIENNK